jgi:hypothetical protein
MDTNGVLTPQSSSSSSTYEWCSPKCAACTSTSYKETLSSVVSCMMDVRFCRYRLAATGLDSKAWFGI